VEALRNPGARDSAKPPPTLLFRTINVNGGHIRCSNVNNRRQLPERRYARNRFEYRPFLPIWLVPAVATQMLWRRLILAMTPPVLLPCRSAPHSAWSALSG